MATSSLFGYYHAVTKLGINRPLRLFSTQERNVPGIFIISLLKSSVKLLLRYATILLRITNTTCHFFSPLSTTHVRPLKMSLTTAAANVCCFYLLRMTQCVKIKHRSLTLVRLWQAFLKVFSFHDCF